MRAMAVGGAVLVLTTGIFFGSTFYSRAQLQLQTEVAQIQPEQAQAIPEKPDSLVRVVAESQGLLSVPFEKLPRYGTYWQALNPFGSIMAPMPWLPNDAVQVFEIAPNQFLVDNGRTAVIPQPLRRSKLPPLTPAEFVAKQVGELVSLIDQVQTAQKDAELKALAGQSDEKSLVGESSVGISARSFLTFPDPGLWIFIPTNALAMPTQFSVILTNTIPGEPYDVLTQSALNDPIWNVEVANVYAPTNFIPVTVNRNGRTNLFVWARYAGDSTGSGIPDWWLLQYFGTTDVDPYGDPDGDGWNNLQEYQNGTSPTFTNTPPPPSNVMVRLDSTGTNFIFTWQPAAGPISEYVISSEYYGELGRVGPSVTTFVTPVPTWVFGDTVIYDYDDYFSVEAKSVDGDISTGGDAGHALGSTTDDLWKKAEIVRGPGGTFYLVLNSPATNLAAVRISGDQFYQTIGEEFPSFDVPISAFTNGVAALSKSETELCFRQPDGTYNTVNARGITTEGKIGGKSEDILSSPVSQHHEFVNASAQLKQNLQFLLRSATVTRQFGMYAGYNGPSYALYYPEPTNNYAYASYGGPDELNEVYQHFIWRNFVFNSADGLGIWATCDTCPNNVESVRGWGGTGVAYSDVYDWRVLFGGYYLPGYTNPPPLAFTLSSSSYIYYRNLPIPGGNSAGFAEIGLVPHTDATLSLDTGVRNVYGLPINSVQVLNSNSIWTVSAGGTIGPLVAGESSRLFANVASPVLQTVSYYFTQAGANNPTPGASDFTTSQATSLLVAAWDEPTSFTGWAKQAITNGYSGKFAYLQQYFDKAYKVNTNGVVTSQTTGVVSPYGEFYPTETGPVALVTMPDIETGQRGTGVVQVVKMQLDVNHDGIMDTSLTGPDNTSPDNPFVFWVNNNFDRGHTVDGTDFEQDDLGDADIRNIPAYQRVPDCNYVNVSGQSVLPCERDLEDYARLWIPGLSSLLAATPTNYTVRLVSLGGVRIYRAIEPSGGTNYLFDELTASNQVANSQALFLGEPYVYYSSGIQTYVSPIILNGTASLGEHFIFCGKQPGYTKLSLQVLDENNYIVCNADANIQFKDIKDMYERWTVGERPAYAPTNITQRAVEDLPSGDTKAFAFPTNTDTNTPYILFVHGWNMETWEKDRYAETAYKRLYWQGYQGRFGSFRWPTDSGITGTASAIYDHKNYDNSEFNAWKSGAGLLNLLTNLNAQYAGQTYLMAHSMGNVVASEALRKAETNLVVNIYVAMQGAIPAHCYDATTENRFSFVPQPDRYAIYWTNGAPSYFNSIAGAGTFVNFFNINDYALNLWKTDQDFKPDVGYGYDGATDLFSRGTLFPTALYFPTNTYEIFAYVDPAWSYALGAQANVGGAFKTGPNYHQVELDILPYNFNSAHKYHSGQFRSDNMSRAIFWNAVLGKMNLLP